MSHFADTCYKTENIYFDMMFTHTHTNTRTHIYIQGWAEKFSGEKVTWWRDICSWWLLFYKHCNAWERTMLITKYKSHFVTFHEVIFVTQLTFLWQSYIYIYIYISKLADRSRGRPEGSLFVATTPKCMRGRYSFPWIDLLTLDPCLIMLSVKQGGIKCHVFSLWYDPICDWTLISRTIGEYITNHIYVRVGVGVFGRWGI